MSHSSIIFKVWEFRIAFNDLRTVTNMASLLTCPVLAGDGCGVFLTSHPALHVFKCPTCRVVQVSCMLVTACNATNFAFKSPCKAVPRNPSLQRNPVPNQLCYLPIRREIPVYQENFPCSLISVLTNSYIYFSCFFS